LLVPGSPSPLLCFYTSQPLPRIRKGRQYELVALNAADPLYVLEVCPVMENSPPRQIQPESKAGRLSPKQPDMAMVAASPLPLPGFQSEYRWNGPRPSSRTSKPTPDAASVSLPSIRLAFPELHLPSKPQEAQGSAISAHTSPVSTTGGHLTSPGYVHSPGTSKRRRNSAEDDQERERARQVPRLYRSPDLVDRRVRSPAQQAQSEGWTQPTRPSPFASRTQVPAPVEVQEPRPSLPSLPPTLSMDRAPAPKPQAREYHTEEYVDQHSTAHHQGPPPSWDAAAPRYGTPGYDYRYHRPGHAPSSSTGSIHYDRTPFSSGAYARPYPEYSRYPELGTVGISGDTKQRKRRGNLPKETTDKLRAWFVAHLSHPYPTEDEKQDLMRQTGLQMNQISNWFINARRRQLPAMISNARVESDAMSNRASDAAILPTTERVEFHGGSKPDGGALSEGEGGGFDDDADSHSGTINANKRRGAQTP
jgi:hypothetical protein